MVKTEQKEKRVFLNDKLFRKSSHEDHNISGSQVYVRCLKDDWPWIVSLPVDSSSCSNVESYWKKPIWFDDLLYVLIVCSHFSSLAFRFHGDILGLTHQVASIQLGRNFRDAIGWGTVQQSACKDFQFLLPSTQFLLPFVNEKAFCRSFAKLKQ
jgi:hypothetical protein